MPKDTRDVLKELRSDPRITERKGKGDHRNFKVEGEARLITIDTGRKQINDTAYKKIREIAGWDQ